MTKQKIDKNYLDYIPVKNPDIDYETNEKTARICTGICDDHHDLSAISGICSNQKTKIKCKDNDTSGGTEKDPESKECREKGQIEVVQQ